MAGAAVSLGRSPGGLRRRFELQLQPRRGSGRRFAQEGRHATSRHHRRLELQHARSHVLRSPSPTPLANADVLRGARRLDQGRRHDGDAYLAEEMTPNADATEWTIKLKPGITWHNGKDFTADDVAYTLQLHREEQEERRQLPLPSRPGRHEEARQADAAGADEVAVQHVHPGAAHVVPPHRPGGLRPTRSPNGTGPFKITSFSPAADRSSSGTRTTGNRALPYLDGVTMIEFADETAMINALLGGQVGHDHPDLADQIPSLRARARRSSSLLAAA